MSYTDTESGETAPLKPTTVQKTRGLTALVVACAALSFFAGATAATAAVAGPTELWAVEITNSGAPHAPGRRACLPLTSRFSQVRRGSAGLPEGLWL